MLHDKITKLYNVYFYLYPREVTWVEIVQISRMKGKYMSVQYYEKCTKLILMPLLNAKIIVPMILT